MARDRIDVAAQRATLILDDRPSDTLSFAEVRELHVVEMAFPLLQGEEPFFVLTLSDRAWVIPDDIIGLDTLMAALASHLFEKEQVFKSTTWKIPWSWRKGRFLRPFPIPRLAMHSIETVPQWDIRTMHRAELEELMGAEYERR